MLKRRPFIFVKSTIIIILILLFILNGTSCANTENRKYFSVGNYNISFNISNDCKVVDDNTNNLLLDVYLNDADGFWSSHFLIIEDNHTSNKYTQNLAQTLIEFLKLKFNISSEISASGLTDKMAFKVSFDEPSIKRSITGFHYYLMNNTTHIIIWTKAKMGVKSNDKKATLIFNSTNVSAIL